MLVFNYTLNICSAVGIRVAPIRTSFRTPPPLLPVTGFRFLVISSLVYILSRRLSRSMYSFFFFPSFPRFPIHPLSAGRATPVSDYATKTCLPLARWIGTCRFSFLLFSFLLFRPGNGGHGGVLWIVNAHLFSLLWNGVDNDRETKGGERERERGEGLKYRHPKIRQRKFYWKSSLRIMRRYPIFDEYAILMSHLPSRYRIN